MALGKRRRPHRIGEPAALWPLLDQGVVSLGTFLTTIILARALVPDRFGSFVLLYGVMLSLNTVHASLIVYPLSIRLAQLERGAGRAAAGGFLVLTALLALPLATVVFVVGWVLAGVLPAVLGAAALLCWQLQETTRRALMAELRHRAALPGDALSFLGQALGVALLGAFGLRSLSAVLGLMAATSLAAAVLQATLARPARPARADLRSLAGTGWRTGRLVLVSNALGALLMQALPWTLALRQGRAAVGAYQALANVLGPTNPVMFGLGNLIVPAVARLRAAANWETARRGGLTLVLQGALVLLPYALLLLWLPGPVLARVYGAGSPYAGLVTALRLLTVGYLLLYLAHTASAVLYGLGLTESALAVQLAGAGALLAVGVPLTAGWGLTGAALGTAAVHAARLASCARVMQPARSRLEPAAASDRAG